MPRLSGVATVVPENRIDQSTAQRLTERMFGDNLPGIRRLLPLFEHTGIEKRYFSVPAGWFEEEHSLQERNDIYIRSATDLGTRAARDVLEQTGTAAEEIDAIIYINTTGLATPSIDARLINVLGLRHDIIRTPIWGLGCAGGAAGLSHAYRYLRGHRDHRVLVVAIELCGLTFIRDDYSKSNFVACALFGDGAAAALICGDGVDAGGLEILATQSRFYPDSLSVMGWNIVSRGMQVVFDKRIPEIVLSHAREELISFLFSRQIQVQDVRHFLYHPGGMKVIDAYESAYGVGSNSFQLSRDVLREYGNMSSATVLFVVARYLERHGLVGDGYGVVSALGPGFCSESLLLRLG